MMRYGGFGFSLIGLGIACLLMLCVVAILVLGIIFIARLLRKSSQNSAQNALQTPVSNAMNILNERFAKGEISEEEYQMKKSQINK
jgi:putative membrane protein